MANTSRPAPTRKVELLAAGAATVTVVLWASAFVSIRSAGEAYSPGAADGHEGRGPQHPSLIHISHPNHPLYNSMDVFSLKNKL
ncbi:hypothetical protein PV460_21515, partial [Streptomyces scabiei]|nr:hypothetical protein [Streptomyces scabiei]